MIQASSQIKKNQLLYDSTRSAVEKDDEVINFGVYPQEETLSYVQVALLVGLLINSDAIDFVITGCSSGNGMNIACNTMPNVISGYLPTPSDAYLFGRINYGNCVSLPLGLNFGWAGELNISYTLAKLFNGPMNTGYPQGEALRKQWDAKLLLEIKRSESINMIDIMEKLDEEVLKPIWQKQDVLNYVIENGNNQKLRDYLIQKI
ncbi:hypothetical protein FC97_GL000584 [Companilactobacillus kimchii DSM 13961 = JCM 10707]|uniref:Sugar phosphate isomerase n=1 Tax=Companilactobacillus kimchii DSM 13961 = JCM 10707 TaxID=1423765 RepID=A0ABR5NTV6_9LACO|nr:hypothetical protein FC97_GL000584 [Companilactobacillus kimchii DSM 13961 = JCM 10707]